MLKKIIVASCLLLCLGACSFVEDPFSDAEAELPPEPADHRTVHQAFFLVDNDLDDAFLIAAQDFVYTVSGLTQGQLEIEVRTARNAVNSLDSGGAQLVFLDSASDQTYYEGLGVLATPFLYSGYQVFTMVCNAEDVRQMFNEEMPKDKNAQLLAAYYKPGMQLLSTWQPSDITGFAQTPVAVDPNSGSGGGFESLGAVPTEEPDPQRRIQMLLEGEVQAAELTLWDMESINWTDTDLYLTLTGHTAAPVWLMVGNDFFGGLTQAQRAAVHEAAAQMYGRIDQEYLRREAEIVRLMEEQGVLLYRDFSPARRQVFAGESTGGEQTVRSYVFDYVSRLQ